MQRKRYQASLVSVVLVGLLPDQLVAFAQTVMVIVSMTVRFIVYVFLKHAPKHNPKLYAERVA